MEVQPVYTIESADGTRLFYEAPTLEGILNAAACIHEDFPDEDFVVMRGGLYDGAATLLAKVAA